ncbi:MAG: acyltransferase [Lacisediminihabitans sp.]
MGSLRVLEQAAPAVIPGDSKRQAPVPVSRFRSLDGLRGAAAVIVLLHHLSLTIPSVSLGYDSRSAVSSFSIAWWALESPVKIFLAGPEFVLVFFVLSGFVLSLSPLARIDSGRAGVSGERGAYDWVSYYPRRILRLGIPVVASLVLAMALIGLMPRAAHSTGSTWLTRQAHPDLSIHHLVAEALLIVDPNQPSVNSSLWSLTWEMWFSLLLPVAILIVVRSRQLPLLWAALFVAVSVYGYVAGVPAMMFLPAFALGGLLGANAYRIQRSLNRCRRRGWLTSMWVTLAVSGPMLSISYWLLRPVLSGPTVALAMAMRVPGAVIMVATVAFWPAASRFFSSNAFRGLGRVSYSLYLVQAPIVIGIGLHFIAQPWWVRGVLTLITCTVVATAMYFLVEKPSTTLAALAGKRVSKIWEAATIKWSEYLPSSRTHQQNAVLPKDKDDDDHVEDAEHSQADRRVGRKRVHLNAKEENQHS